MSKGLYLESITCYNRTNDERTTMDETAECVCGGDIHKEDGVWYHSRIEDFSHTATPKGERS